MTGMDSTQEEGRSGLFSGMIAPGLLAALGGLLVLRGGVVVGSAGLLGGLLVWAAAAALTACTAASLSAVLTNARPGATSTLGAIRTSLGRGVVSVIGLPMWLSRGFVAALGALAIAECFDALSAARVLVALCVVLLAGIGAWLGGPLVRAAVPVVLALVVLGIAAMVTGPTPSAAGPWILPADYGALFALTLPIAAGIWAAPDAVAATGEVRRHSPLWWGLGLGWLIQLVVLAWFGQLAPSAVLIDDPRIGLDGAAIPILARAGLVAGAAFSAVAALQDGGVLLDTAAGERVPSLGRPGSGELATTGVALATVITLRDLDGAATAATLALLFAFATVNAVVSIELVLGLSSFRPSVRLSPLIPVCGGLGSAAALLLTHPAGAILLSASVLAATLLLLRPSRSTGEYSALLAAVGERLARRTSARLAVRAWKPSMLVPVRDADGIGPALDLLADIAHPEGTVRFLGLGPDEAGIDRLVTAVRARGIDSDGTTIACESDPTPIALDALRIALFRPNLLVIRLPAATEPEAEVRARVGAARRTRVGVLVLGTPEGAPVIGARRTITLWVRSIPDHWDPMVGYEGRNLDLTLLLGYRLARRWGSQLRLVTVVTEPEHRLGAERFLASLCSLARLPADTARLVIVGRFEQAVEDMSNSDLDVFGLQPEPDLPKLRELVVRARSTCLFVLDSGRESALV